MQSVIATCNALFMQLYRNLFNSQVIEGGANGLLDPKFPSASSFTA